MAHKHLSTQQQCAHDTILKWYRCRNPPVFHLDGLAGSGKTELVVRLGTALDGVQFAAFTGKAAAVLRQRGAGNAATLHSLLYGAPAVKDDGGLVWRRRDDMLFANLIVADECSTIDRTLGRDLCKTGVKILLTGDAHQLPPVNGDAFFDGRPDFSLTEIHRQAAGSQPLQLATAIRKGQSVRPVRFDIGEVIEADILICALNATRRQLNELIRRARGIAGDDPVVGDRIVCLHNNPVTGVYNGTLWTIAALQRDARQHCVLQPGQIPPDLLLRMGLVDDIGNETSVVAHDHGFHISKLNMSAREYRNLDLFDFGYCLTAHKAQGSEWDNVVVIDETHSVGFAMIAGQVPLAEYTRRWLYTAVTRARESVTIMGVPS